MLKVGIVGLGGISKVHLDGYRELEGVKLVAAADVRADEAPRAELARELGAKIYKSLDEMLQNEKLDMLDICTPTPYHLDMAKRALSLGLNVLLEKPMCRTSAECLELAELAKGSKGKLMVAHVVRFMKPYAYLASVVKSGELGRPVHIMMRRLSAVPRWSWQDWMVGNEISGGCPLDLSIHDIDFVYSVFGEPKAVTGSYRPFSAKEGFGANEYISSELIYDGMSVNIYGGFYDTDIPFTADYVAIFEGGRVELKDGKVYKCGEEVNLDEAVAGSGEGTGINISSSGAYTAEIAYFTDCIEKDKAPDFITPESSMGSVKLVERILASVVRV